MLRTQWWRSLNRKDCVALIQPGTAARAVTVLGGVITALCALAALAIQSVIGLALGVIAAWVAGLFFSAVRSRGLWLCDGVLIMHTLLGERAFALQEIEHIHIAPDAYGVSVQVGPSVHHFTEPSGASDDQLADQARRVRALAQSLPRWTEHQDMRAYVAATGRKLWNPLPFVAVLRASLKPAALMTLAAYALPWVAVATSLSS